MLKDLVRQCRSYRRFYEEERISEDTLKELVDLARLSGSTANSQALKYYLAVDEAVCARIFETLTWAKALPDWDGPAEGERPTAYIVIACDQTLGKHKMWDEGIAAQSIMLGAVEKGLGGCMIGNFDPPAVKEALGLAENLTPVLLVAVGKPKETIVLTEAKPGDPLNYTRDENNVHYVPKRRLEDIVL